MKVFGGRAIAAIRLGQFAAGLLTVWICARISQRIFGARAGKGTFVIGLFFPTLAVVTGEILTETSGVLISVVFFYLLVCFYQNPTWRVLTGLSVVVGVATLVRFNMALFGIVLIGLVFFRPAAYLGGGASHFQFSCRSLFSSSHTAMPLTFAYVYLVEAAETPTSA